MQALPCSTNVAFCRWVLREFRRAMAERRSAVMILADAWWEEPGGSLKQGKVRIVNKSVSGACVRFERPIQVGTKLRIEARWDEFSGIAKYCRSEGSGFLVGIQRQIGVDLIPKQPVESAPARTERRRDETNPAERRVPDGVGRQRNEPLPLGREMSSSISNQDAAIPSQHDTFSSHDTAFSNRDATAPTRGDAAAQQDAAVRNRDELPLRENVTGAHRAGEERGQSPRIAEFGLGAPRNQLVAEQAPAVAVEVLAPELGYKRSSRRRWHSSRYQGVRSQEWWEARATLLLKQKEAQREPQEAVQTERGSTAVEINWMGRGKRGVEDASENGSAGGGDTGERNRAAAPLVAEPPRKERAAAGVERHVTYQNELLPLEEIYAAAGIVGPRRGYSIKKVMEMLQSEHLSALSKEMRRASVMMALDAAGVSVEEVLRDAQVRLDAIKSYEAEQKQLCEAEWARKTDEHAQLKAELEQVRARFMERMKQALDGIARDRARFGTWLTTLHEEAQSIATAAELCMKAAPPLADSVAAAVEDAKETRLKVV